MSSIRSRATGNRGGGNEPRDDRDVPNYGEQLRRARFGLAIGVVTVGMLFFVFTATYVGRRLFDESPGVNSSVSIRASHWTHLQLPIALLLFNSLLLVASSATVEMGRRQVTQRAALAPVEGIPGVSLGHVRSLPWLQLTIVLGFGFVAGQVIAWDEMATRGYYLSTTPSSTFVYLATILHAVHVGAGLIALLCAAGMGLLRASWDARRIVVDICGWYWHFMAVLWIYLFGLLVVMS
jgi:cytochrome c oxidase subunit 3